MRYPEKPVAKMTTKGASMQKNESLKRALAALCLLLLTVAFIRSVAAQADFYSGKTVRIVVGLSSGGGYDRAARMMARQMGKYIPGNPSIVVQNMPGSRLGDRGQLRLGRCQTGRADDLGAAQ